MLKNENQRALIDPSNYDNEYKDEFMNIFHLKHFKFRELLLYYCSCVKNTTAGQDGVSNKCINFGWKYFMFVVVNKHEKKL